jgi:hypothetical protein
VPTKTTSKADRRQPGREIQRQHERDAQGFARGLARSGERLDVAGCGESPKPMRAMSRPALRCRMIVPTFGTALVNRPCRVDDERRW